jgi:hypothetical protein
VEHGPLPKREEGSLKMPSGYIPVIPAAVTPATLKQLGEAAQAYLKKQYMTITWPDDAVDGNNMSMHIKTGVHHHYNPNHVNCTSCEPKQVTLDAINNWYIDSCKFVAEYWAESRAKVEKPNWWDLTKDAVTRMANYQMPDYTALDQEYKSKLKQLSDQEASERNVLDALLKEQLDFVNKPQKYTGQEYCYNYQTKQFEKGSSKSLKEQLKASIEYETAKADLNEVMVQNKIKYELLKAQQQHEVIKAQYQQASSQANALGMLSGGLSGMASAAGLSQYQNAKPGTILPISGDPQKAVGSYYDKGFIDILKQQTLYKAQYQSPYELTIPAKATKAEPDIPVIPTVTGRKFKQE